MRFFPFKILILSLLLPPFLYFFSVYYLEQRLKESYLEEVKDVYIGDTHSLFDGSVSIRNAVDKNITRYLQSKWFLKWGLKLNVVVTTKQGKILFPSIFGHPKESLSPLDPMRVASENYRLLNEGLIVHIGVELEHGKPISILILFAYIGLALFLLYFFTRRAMKNARKAEIEKAEMIDRLLEREKRSTEVLKTLGMKRSELKNRYNEIKRELEDEKLKASKNEDEMIEEIVSLEEEINRNIDLQQEQQKEIDELKEKIRKSEGGQEKGVKGTAAVTRRFNALYKNITINKKAISGFINLSEDMKIKCEEVIHQLNENPDYVTIKRKVFSRKSRETVLEVLFAYRGRLYFRMSKDQHVEILTIGTKNTQLKDLEFIDRL
ncbi:MAG: hypothetical protein R6X10_04705 [Desulfobacterales bacterium]